MTTLKDGAEIASTNQKFSDYLTNTNNSTKTPFEKVEAEVRWKFDIEDRINELETIPDQIKAIQKTLQELRDLSLEIKKRPDDNILDNNDLQKMLKISKRTLQTWRNERIIPYSQVNSKLFYRLSDVITMLNNKKISNTNQTNIN